jgi:hypothetical protein
MIKHNLSRLMLIRTPSLQHSHDSNFGSHIFEPFPDRLTSVELPHLAAKNTRGQSGSPRRHIYAVKDRSTGKQVCVPCKKSSSVNKGVTSIFLWPSSKSHQLTFARLSVTVIIRKYIRNYKPSRGEDKRSEDLGPCKS